MKVTNPHRHNRNKLAAIKEYPLSIRHIDTPTLNQYLTAVRLDPEVLDFTVRQLTNILPLYKSEELRLIAVARWPLTIRFMDNPSETVKMAAVRMNPEAIQFFDASEYIQRLAVRIDPSVMRLIRNPIPEYAMAVAASRSGSFSISYIGKPSRAVQMAANRINAKAVAA